MEDLRLQAVAARVAAWHNRHPLARRITPAQVHSIGYVALPFSGAAAGAAPPRAGDGVPAAGGSLRERALARAQGQEPAPAAALPAPALADLQAVFSEDLIAPIGPRQVAAWARRQGRLLAVAPSDGPLRVLAASTGARTWPIYVMTAAIDLGALRSRVLVGAGDRAAVLGPRLWSRPRLAALAVFTLAVPALVLGLALGRGAARPSGLAAAALAPASGASAAHGESVTVAQVAPASAAASGAASATEGVLPAQAAASAIDVEPRAGRVTLPPLGPVERAGGRAAAPASAPTATAEAGAQDPALAPGVTTAAVPAAAPHSPEAPPPEAASPQKGAPPASPPTAPRDAAAAVAATAPGGAFALSTRPLRTRAEAEQVMAAMAALLQTVRATGTPPVKVEILPEGLDWRVVGWAYAARQDADKARALLVARGMRVEVIAF